MKLIPEDRVKNYEVCGFEIRLTGNNTLLAVKEIATATSDSTISLDMKAPYLIQRGRIQYPLVKDRTQQVHVPRLSEAVALDYMGAAEFEYGALPRSLRAVQHTMPLYTEYVFPGLKRETEKGEIQTLRVFGNFDTPLQVTQYMAFLEEIIQHKLYVKEATRFTDVVKPEWWTVGYYPDFWWDIQNHVFMYFDKRFGKQLPRHLQSSFTYMEAQNAKTD
jgi:hypothetical protein